MDDAFWMRLALEEAALAEMHEDVPVGAVAVLGDQVIGRGHNRREVDRDPSAHAEMIALREASHTIHHWRLDEVTLYCTLEPCVMCAGAIIAARIQRLVFGARDLRFGGVRSKFRLADSDVLNHSVEVIEGVLAVECVELLRNFFESRRP